MYTLNKSISIFVGMVLVLLGTFGVTQSAKAANTLCVDPGNTPACFATIQAAIDAATSGDTINVAPGTYNENVVINKNDISLIGALAMNANDVPDPAIHTIINGNTAPAVITSPGIAINNGITGVSIKNLRVQNFSSNSGIYGALGNNNLTIDSVHVYNNNTNAVGNNGGIYMNGPVSNVLINNVDSRSNKQRGIVIWNGFKQNITITNNYVANNACCGIELQDGTASGVTITGNTVISNSDSGIAAIGLTSGAGPNVISNNTVTNNGRFGIEIKMPNGTGAASGDGSIVVENNTVSLPSPGADLRDFAGIAVMRRGYNVGPGYGYVNIPTGVIVRNNTVSDYRQTNVGSFSTGFGIVAEGTKLKVEGNTLTNNDVGVQVQSGHTPYTGLGGDDGDQSNLADTYFGRGNSPVACVYVPAGSNSYSGNGVDSRNVGTVGSAGITNMDTGAHFCSIQEAIDDATTLNSHTISIPAGTYTEDLTIDKSLTLLGPNSAINPNTGTRVAEAVLHPVTSNPNPAVCTVMAYLSVSNITIKGFTFDGDNPSLTSGIMIGTADVDACEIMAGYEGMGNIKVENNILKNSTYSGVDFYNYTNSAATSGNYIRYNLFEDIGETTYNWGIGVLIYNNFYADITDNVFTGVRTGVQTGNFEKANPGTTGSISNNQIGTWRLGIFHNLAYSNASALTLSNNTITAENYTGATKWNGILLSSIGGAVNATVSGNNIIIPGTVSYSAPGYTAGYNVWNVTTTAPITIGGGTVTGGDYGVWVNNYTGYTSAATSTAITIDGVDISNASLAGIYVQDDPLNTNVTPPTVNATILNSPISNSTVGVLIEGSDATATGSCNQISSNTNGVNNTTTTLLTFEKNWWGSMSGPSGSGLGTGDTVSANVDFTPWSTDTTCTTFAPPFPLVVTANNQTITVGQLDPTFTFSYGGFVFGDTSAVIDVEPTCSVTGPHSQPGVYPIVCSDGSDTNYTFSYVNGTLTVNAANSAPIDIALSSTAVNQNQPIGTVVGTFSSTDPDAGDTFTYSLVAGAGSTDNASFSISGNQLRTAAVFDFATKSSYSIRVRSTDSGSLFFDKEFTITVNSPAPPTTLVNSILPTSRSIQVGTLATVFHTVINAGANPAIGVTLSMASAPAGTFAYQQTDCATNAVLGPVNPSLDMAPGGVLCYVLSFTPSATFNATSVQIQAQASNAPSTSLLPGVNTWLLRSTLTPEVDIIGLTTTTDFHQVACTGANVFAVALANVGVAATGDITVTANTGTAILPLSISISEIDSVTAAVIGDNVLQNVGAGENRSVAVFVTFNGCVSFDPAVNRIFIEFRDAANNVVGSTSTAVSTGR